MARKKEYAIANDESAAAAAAAAAASATAASAANNSNSKRKQSKTISNSSNDTQNKPEINRAKLATKRKEAANVATGARNVYDVGDLRAQLGSFGLTVRDIPGDGNCLFRALGDQLDGHTANHIKHRLDTVRYMIAHRGHFEPFIDVPFDRYISEMSRPGTYAGQDALVAFARLHKVNIIIHQLNRPLWKIQGSDHFDAPELHLSYHNGEHYSSVRRFGDIADTPAGIRIMKPTAIPCCATHSIYTSAKPITVNSSSENRHAERSGCIQEQNHILTEEDVSAVEQPFIQNEDDFANFVQEVMNRSGCRDSTIATEALIENGYDIDQTVDYLLSLAFFFEPLNQKNKEMSKSEKSAVAASGCNITKLSSINDAGALNRGSLQGRVRAQLITNKADENYKSNENIQKGSKGKQNDLSFLTL